MTTRNKISPRDLAARKVKARLLIRKLKKLFPEAGMILNYSNHWELLVAVMLSAQCTDKQVNKVTATLFKKYRTIEDYAHAKQSVFERDVYSTGFYRNKAKNIIAAANYLLTHHDGGAPRTMDEMLMIPGVARKTANVVLGNAYDIYEGIAVDTSNALLDSLASLLKPPRKKSSATSWRSSHKKNGSALHTYSSTMVVRTVRRAHMVTESIRSGSLSQPISQKKSAGNKSDAYRRYLGIGAMRLVAR